MGLGVEQARCLILIGRLAIVSFQPPSDALREPA